MLSIVDVVRGDDIKEILNERLNSNDDSHSDDCCSSGACDFELELNNSEPKY